MVILPFSPTACALVTTMLLSVAFYAGRYWGMKLTINLIKEEIAKMKEHMTKYQNE